MAGAAHKNYDEIAKQRMLEYPIVYLLSHLGYQISLPGGKLSGVTSSPFREDKTPSFSISFNKDCNCWMAHDHATGEGWNNLSIVKKVLNCNGGEAWDYLATVVGTVPQEKMNEIRRQTSLAADSSASINKVIYVHPGITFSFLLEYARMRGIDTRVLNRYCSQITYKVGDYESKHYAIGFPNCSDGWVLREADILDKETGKLRKRTVRCTNSDFTHISADARYIGKDEIKSNSLAIFEGFFDFMAWVSWRMEANPKELLQLPCDVIVLNSTVNLNKALDCICQYDYVYGFFDLDKTGREHEQECCRAMNEENSRDGRTRIYTGCTEKFVPEGTVVRRLDGDVVPAKDIADAYKAHCDNIQRKSTLTPSDNDAADDEYKMIHKM